MEPLGIREMLMLAARSGDHNALRQLVNSGVDINEIFPERKNEKILKHEEFNYIFINYDEDYDNTHIELITTDFKQAFEYAYSNHVNLMVWINGEDEDIFDIRMTDSLDEAYRIFSREIDGRYSNLAIIALPLIEEKKKLYEEEKIRKEQEKVNKSREKELRELARLKAKYENE